MTISNKQTVFRHLVKTLNRFYFTRVHKGPMLNVKGTINKTNKREKDKYVKVFGVKTTKMTKWMEIYIFVRVKMHQIEKAFERFNICIY